MKSSRTGSGASICHDSFSQGFYPYGKQNEFKISTQLFVNYQTINGNDQVRSRAMELLHQSMRTACLESFLFN